MAKFFPSSQVAGKNYFWTFYSKSLWSFCRKSSTALELRHNSNTEESVLYYKGSDVFIKTPSVIFCRTPLPTSTIMEIVIVLSFKFIFPCEIKLTGLFNFFVLYSPLKWCSIYIAFHFITFFGGELILLQVEQEREIILLSSLPEKKEVILSAINVFFFWKKILCVTLFIFTIFFNEFLSMSVLCKTPTKEPHAIFITEDWTWDL